MHTHLSNLVGFTFGKRLHRQRRLQCIVTATRGTDVGLRRYRKYILALRLAQPHSLLRGLEVISSLFSSNPNPPTNQMYHGRKKMDSTPTIVTQHGLAWGDIEITLVLQDLLVRYQDCDLLVIPVALSLLYTCFQVLHRLHHVCLLGILT